MKAINPIILFIVVILSIQYSFGQKIFDTRIIEIEQGLHERTVNKIQRDKYGYFYFITENYIQQWDGESFKDIDATGISSSIFKNSETKFELLNDSTLVVIDNNDIYTLDQENLQLIKKNKFWPENSKIVYSSGNLYCIDKDQDKTTLSILHQDKIDSLIEINQSIEIENLAQLADRIIIQTVENTIYSYIYGSKLLVNNSIEGKLISDKIGNVVVANDIHIYKYQDEVFHLVGKSVQDSLKLRYLDHDNNGNIAIGYSKVLRRIQELHIINKLGVENIFSQITKKNNKIKDIYADNYYDKVLLATYNGIYFYKLTGNGIKSVKRKKKKNKSEFGYLVSGVTKDSMSNIYFSKEGLGLYKYIPATEDTINLLNNTKYFKGNLKLLFDNDQNMLWSNGFNSKLDSDLYSMDLNSKVKHRYPMSFMVTDFIDIDKNEFLLVGKKVNKINGKMIRKPRIAKYNKENHTTEFLSLLDDNSSSIPRCLFVYKDYIFIGTTGGLFITDKSLSSILKIIDEKTTKSNISLKADWIVFVKPFHNYIMVGTNGDGIFLLDPNNFTPISKINTEDGMSDNIAITMETDAVGNAWVTTYNGITIIDSTLNIIRIVEDFEGLSDREFSSLASTKLDNQLYFGTNNGMTVIDPEKFLSMENSSGLNIASIEIINKNGESLKYSDWNKKIRVNSKSEKIIITVDFPDYYKYYNTNTFTDYEVKSECDFTLLDNQIIIKTPPSGIYPITISNNVGTRLDNITLEVKTYFPWAQATLFLLITFLAFIISKNLIRRNKLIEEEKTQYNKKISELRLNALKSQMNPHFIFNSLGAIQYFIQSQNTERADEYLSKFAKLMRLILESSKNDYISIRDEMNLMELYVDLEQVRFEGQFTYTIEIDEQVDEELLIPPMIVQPLVENAINHGLFNLKDRKGYLELLTTYISENQIEIKVRDNGVGRSYEKSNVKKSHKSRGMEILKERVDIINSADEMKVNIAINDLMENQLPAGTEVIISINYSH